MANPKQNRKILRFSDLERSLGIATEDAWEASWLVQGRFQ